MCGIESSGICTLCSSQSCKDGQYLAGCEELSAGICTECTKECPNSTLLVACGGISAGSCIIQNRNSSNIGSGIGGFSVSVVLILPMTKAQFETASVTSAFFSAFASASLCEGNCSVLAANYAVCGSCNILLNVVQEERRLASTPSLSISATITLQSLQEAEVVADRLQTQSLNFELVKKGLPLAVIAQNATINYSQLVTLSPTKQASGKITAAVVGGIVGGSVAGIMVAAALFTAWRKSKVYSNGALQLHELTYVPADNQMVSSDLVSSAERTENPADNQIINTNLVFTAV